MLAQLKSLILGNEELLQYAKAGNYGEIVARLNARPIIANEELAAKVPIDITVKSLMPILADEELTALLGTGKFTDLIGQILMSDFDAETKALARSLLQEVTEDEPTGNTTTIEVISYIANQNESLLPKLLAFLRGIGILGEETISDIQVLASTLVDDPEHLTNLVGKSLMQEAGLDQLATTVLVQAALNS